MDKEEIKAYVAGLKQRLQAYADEVGITYDEAERRLHETLYAMAAAEHGVTVAEEKRMASRQLAAEHAPLADMYPTVPQLVAEGWTVTTVVTRQDGAKGTYLMVEWNGRRATFKQRGGNWYRQDFTRTQIYRDPTPQEVASCRGKKVPKTTSGTP